MGCHNDVQEHQSVVLSPPKLSERVKSQTNEKQLCASVTDSHDIAGEGEEETVHGLRRTELQAMRRGE